MSSLAQILGLLALALACSGCNALKPSGDEDAPAQPTPARAVQLTERDVEAPDVFQVTSSGIWDGRSSVGGVWVAHDSVRDPDRALIRNEDNGQFVIGALFRKDKPGPGPEFQVSSDAAQALGMVAGSPARLSVTAVRREDAAGQTPSAPAPQPAPSQTAAPAIARAPLPGPAVQAAPLAPAAPVVPSQPAPSSLDKPIVQVGIFAVQANATRTEQKLRAQGLAVQAREIQMSGKTFYRVLVGPTRSAAERADALAKVKAAGFADAYTVRN